MSTKIANPSAGPSVFRKLFSEPAFLTMLAAPIVGGAAAAAHSKIQGARDAKKKTEAYREMLNVHPHLKRRDPVEVSRIYNSLHNVNPVLARDPMVSGAWVDNIIESKSVNDGQTHQQILNAVKDLAGIRNQISAARRNEGSNDVRGLAENFTKDFGKAYGQAKERSFQDWEHNIKTELGKKNDELGKRHDELLSMQNALAEDAAHIRQQDEALQLRAQQIHEYAKGLGLKTSSAQPEPSDTGTIGGLFDALGIK